MYNTIFSGHFSCFRTLYCTLTKHRHFLVLAQVVVTKHRHFFVLARAGSGRKRMVVLLGKSR